MRFNWKPKTVLKWVGEDMMHRLNIFKSVNWGHLSSDRMALGLACKVIQHPVSHIHKIASIAYTQTFRNTRSTTAQDLGNQAAL